MRPKFKKQIRRQVKKVLNRNTRVIKVSRGGIRL